MSPNCASIRLPASRSSGCSPEKTKIGVPVILPVTGAWFEANETSASIRDHVIERFDRNGCTGLVAGDEFPAGVLGLAFGDVSPRVGVVHQLGGFPV